jgi:hypothetical protein
MPARPEFLRVAGEAPVEPQASAQVRRAFPDDWLAPWLRARRKLAGAGYGDPVVAAFERGSAGAALVIGPEAAIALADVISAVAIKAGPPAAAMVADAAPAAAARIGDAPRFRSWASLMQRFAAMAPESAAPLLERMDALLARLNVLALEAWLLAGVRAGGGDPERRRAFVAMEDPQAELLLDREAAETTFFDHERRMKAFFTALWGRRVPFRPTPPARHDGAGRRPGYSEGVIQMPPTFPGFRGAQADALFRAALAHIGAHMTFSGPRFPLGKLKPLQVAVVSLIEDARVEALAMREMPGLARLWLPFHVAQASGALHAPSLFARLSRALIDPEFEDVDGWVRKGRDLFYGVESRWDDPAISRAIGDVLGNDLGQMRVQFNAKTYTVEPPYRDDNMGLWDFGENASVEDVETEILTESVRIEQGEEGERERENPRDETARAAPAAADPEEGVPVAKLPEYDHEAGRERPDWTTIVECAPPSGDPRYVETLLDRRADVAARIDAVVRAARVSRAERLKRRAEGETLDIDAAIESAAALRARIAPDPRVYQTTARRRRDLSVSVLLDVSRSTADPSPDGLGTVIDLERDAAALLGHAMAEMGDPFEMLAFDSNGREQVRIFPVKPFGAPFDRAAAAALAGLRPGYSTRIGAVLRYAGLGLAARSTHRRLALLVTDGEPSDIDVADPDYLAQDALRAVRSLRGAGVDVFCIALGAQNVEKLTRIFGARGFIVIERLSALPERLPLLYFKLSR